MSRMWVLFLALATGCSEYNISEGGDPFGAPNPPAVPETWMQDRIVQVTVPEVDVLWVVDNSCSMSEEQAALTVNFPAFMNYFLGSGLDYHVGVVSTDMDSASQSGKLRNIDGVKYLDPDTADPVTIFTDMAVMGTGGSADEKGREAAYTAIELLKDTDNAGFVREQAGMHIVVISDENDSSGANPISKAEFIDYPNTLRPDPEIVTFNSIVLPDEGGFFGGLSAGTAYLDITDAVGGIKRDIRTEDWVELLEELGVQAAGLKREFFLSQLPVPESIEVEVVLPDDTVVPFEVGTDWTYSPSRNSIMFVTFVPDPLSEVIIRYQSLAASSEVIETVETE